jgi:hypothetical protein
MIYLKLTNQINRLDESTSMIHAAHGGADSQRYRITYRNLHRWWRDRHSNHPVQTFFFPSSAIQATGGLLVDSRSLSNSTSPLDGEFLTQNYRMLFEMYHGHRLVLQGVRLEDQLYIKPAMCNSWLLSCSSAHLTLSFFSLSFI